MMEKGSKFKMGICRRVTFSQWMIGSSGSITEGMFMNDKLHGFGRKIEKDGKIKVGIWNNGELSK